MTSQRSLILITVDCLRADHVSFLGYSRPTTPFLESLAPESFVLPVCIAAGSPTYYSLPSVMAARPSLALGRDVLGIAPDEPTLASMLRKHGYHTAAFSAANPYVSRRFGYDSGFDVFHDFLAGELELSSSSRESSRVNHVLSGIAHDLGPLGKIYDELYFEYCQRWATQRPRSLAQLRRFPSADVLVDHAAAWLDSIGKAPFFLWLHLMDPHAPYYPPQEAMERMGVSAVSPFHARYLNSFWNRGDVGLKRLQRQRSDILDLYDSGIRWVDVQLERLIQTVRSLGQWDNCVLSITADHGEEFLDHGGRFHAPQRLFDETLRVPLLLRVPGAKARPQPKSPFSLVHLAPTLLEALEVAIPGEFFGRSAWQKMLIGEGWEQPAISECIKGCTNPYWPDQRSGPRLIAVRSATHKLIVDLGEDQDMLFDLEEDPRELSPLPSDAQKRVRRELLLHARAHLSDEPDQLYRLRARIRDLRLEWSASSA